MAAMAAGTAAVAGTILGRLVALRCWPVLAVVLRHLGLGLLVEASWDCYRGMKSPSARARSARAHPPTNQISSREFVS
jgi:hypothetical protein